MVKKLNLWRHPCKNCQWKNKFFELRSLKVNFCKFLFSRQYCVRTTLSSSISIKLMCRVLCNMTRNLEEVHEKNLIIYIYTNYLLTMQNADWVRQHSAIFHIVINTIDTPKGSREGCRDGNYYLKTTIIIIIDCSISHSGF